MAMIGLYTKDTDGQMYTSSSKKMIHTFEYLYIKENYKVFNFSNKDIKKIGRKRKCV